MLAPVNPDPGRTRKVSLVAPMLLLVSAVAFAARAEDVVSLEAAAAQVTHANDLPGGSFAADSAVWTISPPPRTPTGRNEMRVAFPVAGPLERGRGPVFECELRSVRRADDGAAGQAGLILDIAEQGGDPRKRHSFFRHILLAGPDWEKFSIPIDAGGSAPAGGWQVALVPAHFEQPVEIRGARLRPLRPGELSEPPASYAGQEADAPWRRIAAERIAKHRMGDLSVLVTDRFGKPVPGARVAIEQSRHAYRFGSCVTASRFADAEVTFKDPAMTREKFLADNARYREEFLRLFNYAVFENDLKWPMWDGSNPNFRQQTALHALEWLRDRRIPVKGHTLVWASWRQTPGWLESLKADKAALQAAILRHIRDVGAATAPFTSGWDVLNEPMSHRDIIELLGHKSVAQWFRAAREVLPGQKLVLNDFDLVGNGGNPKRREGLVALVRDLQKLGGAPDVIGCQSHFWSDRLTPPQKLWEILDELHAATGLPLAATEFDLNFPNDRVQADYTRDFLTAWFAHPATESFIMWGFWGGAHWFGERGAMFRQDWTPKPNLAAYEQLVFHDWWTRASLVTNAEGRATVRAFHGEHEIRVTAPGHSTSVRMVSLPAGGRDLEIVIHPAAKPAE